MAKDEIQKTIDDPNVPFDGDPNAPEYLEWLAKAEVEPEVDVLKQLEQQAAE